MNKYVFFIQYTSLLIVNVYMWSGVKKTLTVMPPCVKLHLNLES